MENNNYKGHCLIIGGTRGIGRAVVKCFIQENYKLSVIGKRIPYEKDKEMQGVNYQIVNILDDQKLKGTLETLIQKNGKLNNLIFLQRYRDNQPDAWNGEIGTSLTATKNIIEFCKDHFEEKKENSIVIVSSIASKFIADEQPLSYHVAKAGINQLMKYYAVALGYKKIRVNAVSSGTILKEESKEFYIKNNELQELYKKITPLQRMGTSEDIANVISFLCNEKSSFITGQNIVVDGGASLQWHESLARKLSLSKDFNSIRK